MIDTAQQQLIADLARDLLAETAPQELPLFRASSEAFFKDPQRVMSGAVGKDEPLGFGAGEGTSFIAPVILAVVTQVVTFLAAEVGKAAQSEGSAFVTDTVKALFKRFRPAPAAEKQPTGEAPSPSKPPTPAPVPPVTPELLQRVRELAFQQAKQLRLSDSNARLLADSLVGSLAVPPAGTA